MILHHKYICSACGQFFCDDHCCNASYLAHLSGERIDKAKKEKGYLCTACLQADGYEGKSWVLNIIDRKCAYDGCSTSLNDWTTYKRSCIVCGHWYCYSHTYSKEKFSNTWIKEHTRFENADAVCMKCTDGEVSSTIEEIFEPICDKAKETGSEILSNLNQSVDTLFLRYDDLKNEVKTKSILLGLRAALAALSCSFIVLFTPYAKEEIIDKTFSFSSVWTFLGIISALIFLFKEFIIPGLYIKGAKAYSFCMVGGIILFILASFSRTFN